MHSGGTCLCIIIHKQVPPLCTNGQFRQRGTPLLVVQVVLIAESQRLQAMMATYGIQTQTPHEVEPVQIWPPSQLVKVYEHLGVNNKLGLKGRPGRPNGALGTSKIYRVCGKTALCYPLIFEVSDFYLSHDMALLIDDIKTELMFVGKYWRVSGRPTMVLLIREEHMRDRKFKEMLDLMAELKKGHCEGLKVRIGRLQNLLSSSCIEHLDFMSMVDPDSLGVKPFRQVIHEYSGYQSLTDVPKTLIFNEACHDLKTFSTKQTWEILEAYKQIDGYYARCQLLGFLRKREGSSFKIDGSSVHEHLVTLHAQAGILRVWAAVRYASSLLCQFVDSISPYITTILVNGKQLTFGMIGQEEWVVDKPMSPAEIRDAVYQKVQPHDLIQAVLQQETALYCGKLIVTNPELFEGILNIRLGWILQAIILYKENALGGCGCGGGVEGVGGKGGGHQDNCVRLEQCSPSKVRRLLEAVLSINFDNPERHHGGHHHHRGVGGLSSSSGGKLTVYQKRQIEGCLCRVPSNFYARVWHILKKCPGGIIMAGRCLPQNPTLQHITLPELNFALIVEQMLHRIEHPEYINIVIELLCVVSTILQRNPELGFRGSLDVDKTVASAFKMFQKDKGRRQIQGQQGQVLQKQESVEIKENELYPFFNATTATTKGYLGRGVVNNILQGDMGLQWV